MFAPPRGRQPDRTRLPAPRQQFGHREIATAAQLFAGDGADVCRYRPQATAGLALQPTGCHRHASGGSPCRVPLLHTTRAVVVFFRLQRRLVSQVGTDAAEPVHVRATCRSPRPCIAAHAGVAQLFTRTTHPGTRRSARSATSAAGRLRTPLICPRARVAPTGTRASR